MRMVHYKTLNTLYFESFTASSGDYPVVSFIANIEDCTSDSEYSVTLFYE